MSIVVGLALVVYAVAYGAYQVREVRRMIRAERAFTEAVRAEEQARTAALVEELRRRR